MLFVTAIKLGEPGNDEAVITFEGFDHEGRIPRPFNVMVKFDPMNYSIDDIVKEARGKLSNSLSYLLNTLSDDIEEADRDPLQETD